MGIQLNLAKKPTTTKTATTTNNQVIEIADPKTGKVIEVVKILSLAPHKEPMFKSKFTAKDGSAKYSIALRVEYKSSYKTNNLSIGNLLAGGEVSYVKTAIFFGTLTEKQLPKNFKFSNKTDRMKLAKSLIGKIVDGGLQLQIVQSLTINNDKLESLNYLVAQGTIDESRKAEIIEKNKVKNPQTGDNALYKRYGFEMPYFRHITLAPTTEPAYVDTRAVELLTAIEEQS